MSVASQHFLYHDMQKMLGLCSALDPHGARDSSSHLGCLNVQLFRPCPASPQMRNVTVGILRDTEHETEEAAAVLWTQALDSYSSAPDLTFSSHVEIGNLQSAFCIVL